MFITNMSSRNQVHQLNNKNIDYLNMTDKYYGLRRRPTLDEMLKEAMTHRLKIEIIPERQVIDLSINSIDVDDFDLSKYDRRLRLNAKVQTDEQVLQHEIFPDMFDEVAPTSQLYENNEADAQTTRYIAKILLMKFIVMQFQDQKMNQKMNQKMKRRKIYKVFISRHHRHQHQPKKIRKRKAEK